MNRGDLTGRLARGGRLLLDGGMGSELQRRGIDVYKGATAKYPIGAWSATALEDAPDVVRKIHEDYLREGADVITTNSYATNRVRLEAVGLAHRMEDYTRLSVEIAREARDRLNPEAYVAGSIGGVGASVGSWDLRKEYADQSAALAEAGADLILLEYIGSISDYVQAVEAVSGTGLSVFLGLRPRTGETVEQLIAALEDYNVDAVLPMCCKPEEISAVLPDLRKAFDGPVGAYANIGYRWVPDSSGVRRHTIDIGENTPERYAQFGREWLDMGAQIVGGCCATGPEHIAALRPVIKGTEGPASK